MFEVQCPSCHASYKVDERRIPPKGLDMRCPKCGSSFQVNAPGVSEPPVLGGALGLGAAPKAQHKATMMGVAGEVPGAVPPAPSAVEPAQAPPRPGPPRPGPPRPAGGKHTMLGVAPQAAGRDKRDSDSLELAPLDDDGDLGPDELEADLPAPGGGLDLPSPGGMSLDSGDELDLPEPAGLGLDLPAPVGAEANLPTPSSRGPAGEIDLPMGGAEEMDLPAPADDGLGLPAPAGGEADLPSLDAGLPDLAGGDEIGLPSPADEAGLPGLAEAELPTLGGAGLPEVSGVGLPEVGGAGLPEVGGAGLPEVGGAELPSLGESELPIVGGSLPAPAEMTRNPTGLPSLAADVPNLDGPALDEGADSLDFGDSLGAPADSGGLDDFSLSGAPGGAVADGESADDLFGPGDRSKPESFAPGSGGEASAFDDVNLEEADDADEFDAFPTETVPASATGTAGGGAGYGDVALDDDATGGGFGVALDDDGGAPPPASAAMPGPQAAASAAVEMPGAESIAPTPSVKAPKIGLSKGVKIGIAAAIVVAVAGGAAGSLSPDIGPYGAYMLIDLVKADSNQSDLARDAQRARKLLGMDNSQDSDNAFLLVDRGRASAPRYRQRQAYAAYLGLYREIRFGVGGTAASQGKALLQGLAERDPAEVEHLQLARLAGQLLNGKSKEVAAQALRRLKSGPEFASLAGEAALLEKDVESAKKAFSSLAQKKGGARAQFGLARVHLLAEEYEEARAAGTQALAENPQHVGATLLIAELDVIGRKKDQEVVDVLTPIAEGSRPSSQLERATALVLLGDLHLGRARIKKAEAAFYAALKLQSGNAHAQRGLADALFEGGSFSEAQTRYEAALKADPSALPAGIGMVRCQLRLEQFEPAAAALGKLGEKYPDSTIVMYWTGRAAEAAGKRDEAQTAYEKAIELGGPSAELVQAYIALTRLLGQNGRDQEAEVVIAQAEKKFPDDALVYEALAELSSGRGSFEEAIADYDRALKLDSGNIGLRFARGIALRQADRLDEAAEEFDRVEAESPDYPGLALERGNLYQKAGREDEALKAYEAALAKSPDDLDLMLRVGCGRAAAGASKEALEVIEKVYEERENSAEVNYCRGRALLGIEGKLGDARRSLLRAIAFDASRAQYHLYVGWVALEMSDYPLARKHLDEAIKLDQTLAEAFLKRGEMMVRQGGVDDAVRDLTKALELNPNLDQAHAHLALAYMQSGKEPAALLEWELATQGGQARAYDHYQYGRLLLDNRRVDESRPQLAKALESLKGVSPSPAWKPDLHRYYAMSLGLTREALDHWKAFVDAAPKTSPYRREAERAMAAILNKLGQ